VNNTRRNVLAFWMAAVFATCYSGAPAQESGKADNSKAPAAPAFTLAKTTLLPCNLPFQIWNGLMTVDAVIGASGTQRFVLDPGLEACTLMPRAAQLVTSAPAGEQARFTIYDQVHTAPLAHLPQLQINSIRVEQLPVGMIDVLGLLSPVSARRLDAPTGWLGATFFSAFQTTYYFDEHSVLLERLDAPLPKGKDKISIPIQIQDGRVMLKLSIPGAKPFLALFSTCSPVTMIPTAAAQQAKLKAAETLTIAQPGGKSAKLGHVVLPKLNLGRISLESVNAAYVAPDAPAEMSRNMAMIGVDLMRHYQVTINYARHVMILTPPAAPGAEKKSSDDDGDDSKPAPKRPRRGNNGNSQ
jgi:hypothetical protein